MPNEKPANENVTMLLYRVMFNQLQLKRNECQIHDWGSRSEKILFFSMRDENYFLLISKKWKSWLQILYTVLYAQVQIFLHHDRFSPSVKHVNLIFKSDLFKYPDWEVTALTSAQKRKLSEYFLNYSAHEWHKPWTGFGDSNIHT